jgi:hypothetical protein
MLLYFRRSKFFALLVLLSILGSGLMAQRTVPGLIAMRNGDTIQGNVNFRDIHTTPTSIRVYQKGQPIPQALDPSKISTVHLNKYGGVGEMWYMMYMPYDTSSIDDTKLDSLEVPQYKSGWVLMHQVYSGSHILYRSVDTSKRLRFFISKIDSTPVELVQKRYRPNRIDAIPEYYNCYRLTLYNLLHDCRQDTTLGTLPEFDEPELVSTLMAYDYCKGRDSVWVARRAKGEWAWYLTGGMATGKPYTRYPREGVQPVSWWVGGTGIEFFWARKERRWATYTELQLTPFKAWSQDTSLFITRDIKHVVRLHTLIRYGSSGYAKQRWFVGSGLSFSDIRQPKKLFPYINNYYHGIGLLFEAGWQTGPLGISLKYDYTVGSFVLSRRKRGSYPLRDPVLSVMASWRLAAYKPWLRRK